jgi:hypothetical protein
MTKLKNTIIVSRIEAPGADGRDRPDSCQRAVGERSLIEQHEVVVNDLVIEPIEVDQGVCVQALREDGDGQVGVNWRFPR